MSILSATRVLIATDLPVWKLESGAMQRIAALANALKSAGLDVHLFYPAHLSTVERAAAAKTLPGIDMHTPHLGWLLLRALRRRIWPVSKADALHPPHTWERRAAFRVLCARLRPAAVIVEYLHLAYLVQGLEQCVSRPPLKIADLIDVLSRRADAFAQAAPHRATPVEAADEIAAWRGFDALLAIQSVEAAQIRKALPSATVLIAGHPALQRPLPLPTGDPITLLYAGAGGAHNVVNAKWLLDNAWPALCAQFGTRIALHICGRICEQLDRDRLPEGIVLRGFVAKMEDVYAQAHIVVNPCVVGSGLKIKNVEALGFGRPLVTTPLGAEGLAADNLVIAPLQDFSAATASLIDDAALRDTYASKAAAYAQAELSPAQVFAELTEYLRSHADTRAGS